jgi:hypothetical protein
MGGLLSAVARNRGGILTRVPERDRYGAPAERRPPMHRLLLVSLFAATSLGGAAALARPHHIHGVASANPRSGSPANVVSHGYELKGIVVGTDPLENPSGVITRFGYLNDFPPQKVEATKTEADENTYLVLDHNPGGPTEGYDYGRRFLFQGHENGADLAYITRVNLDVRDPAHRITLLTPVGSDGKTHFGSIDGSTWDPFSRTLLFTQERGSAGGVIELALDWPANAHTLDGIVGKGGFEGIHPDDRGNLLLIEDVGGVSVNVVRGDSTSPKAAKQPNSFVYRFVPRDPRHLAAGGALQALQVTIDGEPVTFHAADPVGDVFSDAQLKLHTPNQYWPVRWVTVHDTAVDGTAPFDANAAAKAAGATPFKRPENAQFQPGFGFSTFFFDPTGDTNSDSGNQPELAARGAWGSIFRVDLDCSGESGVISLAFLGDAVHNSFDNLAFIDPFTLLAAEDRGDGLHKQLNTLDSIWAVDVFGDPDPRRFIALGRDPASTIDAAFLDAGTAGYQNEGDNEPTGVHVSDGSPSVHGMQGTLQDPRHTRWFFTQQHGENRVYEIVRGDR